MVNWGPIIAAGISAGGGIGASALANRSANKASGGATLSNLMPLMLQLLNQHQARQSANMPIENALRQMAMRMLPRQMGGLTSAFGQTQPMSFGTNTAVPQQGSGIGQAIRDQALQMATDPQMISKIYSMVTRPPTPSIQGIVNKTASRITPSGGGGAGGDAASGGTYWEQEKKGEIPKQQAVALYTEPFTRNKRYSKRVNRT
jgi:hypothetical protein